MKKSSKNTPIYGRNSSGIFIKTGDESNFSQQDTSSYLAVKQKAIELQELYRQNNLALPSTSYLSTLIDDTTILSDAWLCDNQARIDVQYVFKASQLECIAKAALHLGVSEQARKYLSALLNGSLDLLSRDRSIAKDTLWELEFWNILVDFGMSAALEEPDITVNFDGVKIGIACKKFYSENNVSKVLSEAIAQIEDNYDIGVVALNLDELTPANSILKAPSVEKAVEIINKNNDNFISKHERYLRKYLANGRAISALVSTCVLADIVSSKTRIFTMRQATVWSIPGLDIDRDRQLRNFFNAISEAHQ